MIGESQVCELICSDTRAFIKIGLERFHSVAISGFNSPEWCQSALAAILSGGFCCGLYPTNSADMNAYIMNDSKANILVVEDDATLKKMLPVPFRTISPGCQRPT